MHRNTIKLSEVSKIFPAESKSKKKRGTDGMSATSIFRNLLSTSGTSAQVQQGNNTMAVTSGTMETGQTSGSSIPPQPSVITYAPDEPPLPHPDQLTTSSSLAGGVTESEATEAAKAQQLANANKPKEKKTGTVAMVVLLILVLIIIAILAYFAVRAFQRGISEAIVEITEGVVIIADISNTLIQELGVIISSIINFLDTVVTDLDTALTVVSNAIVSSITSLGNALAQNLVPFINSFADVFNTVIDNIIAFWNDHLQSVFLAIANAVTAILNALGL